MLKGGWDHWPFSDLEDVTQLRPHIAALSLTKHYTSGSRPLCSLTIYFINLVTANAFFITLGCKYSFTLLPLCQTRNILFKDQENTFISNKVINRHGAPMAWSPWKMKAIFICIHQQAGVASWSDHPFLGRLLSFPPHLIRSPTLVPFNNVFLVSK